MGFESEILALEELIVINVADPCSNESVNGFLMAHIFTNGKNTMKKLSIAIAAITAGMMGMSAQAYEAGDMIGRVGLAKVSPKDDSSVLKISGVGGVAGTGVEVDDDTQLGLTGTYMLSPGFGVELLAATPFEHDISVNGLGGLGVPNGTKLGSTKHLPPTLSASVFTGPAARRCNRTSALVSTTPRSSARNSPAARKPRSVPAT